MVQRSAVEVGSLSHDLQGFIHPRWFIDGLVVNHQFNGLAIAVEGRLAVFWFKSVRNPSVKRPAKKHSHRFFRNKRWINKKDPTHISKHAKKTQPGSSGCVLFGCFIRDPFKG